MAHFTTLVITSADKGRNDWRREKRAVAGPLPVFMGGVIGRENKAGFCFPFLPLLINLV